MIIDIIVVGLILLAAVVGYKKGLINMITTLLSNVCALVLSIIIYPVIYNVLKLTPIYIRVQEWVKEKVGVVDFGAGLQTQGKAIINNLDWLPEFMSEALVQNNNTEVYKVLGVNNITDYISVSISNVIMALLAILVTWLVLNVILAGGFKMLGKVVASVPIISNVNQLGGLVVGGIKGLLLISIIGLIIPLIMTMPGCEVITQYIEESYLTKWLYENNLILAVINYYFY